MGILADKILYNEKKEMSPEYINNIVDKMSISELREHYAVLYGERYVLTESKVLNEKLKDVVKRGLTAVAIGGAVISGNRAIAANNAFNNAERYEQSARQSNEFETHSNTRANDHNEKGNSISQQLRNELSRIEYGEPMTKKDIDKIDELSNTKAYHKSETDRYERNARDFKADSKVYKDESVEQRKEREKHKTSAGASAGVSGASIAGLALMGKKKKR